MRSGLLPTVLGTAVAGATLYRNGNDVMKLGKSKRHMETLVATGLLGFGLAHIVLGSLDLFGDKDR